MTDTVEDDDFVTPDTVQRFIDKFNKATKGAIERHSAESLDWFRRRISKDSNMSKTRMLKQPGDYKKRRGTENRTLIGKLFYFQYAAENPGDRALGVYDQFPMVFIFNSTRSKEGHKILWGLNMHYATPQQRAVLYSQLLKLKAGKGYTDQTKLRLTWKLIKSVSQHKLYEKCVHAYRVDRLQSQLIEIHPKDWEVAVFLNLQKWVRPPAQKAVQSEIQRKLR